MEIKSVIPLTLRKKEHTLWKESNYEAKAVICDNPDFLKERLKAVVLGILKNEGVAVCIGLGLREIMVEKLKSQFPNSALCGTFKPKGDLVVKPGAVVYCVTNKQDIINLMKYWGTLDGIQIIFPFENSKEDIVHMVCTDNYIYSRHNFDVWNEMMEYAKIVITDTSIGKEFEIVYHNEDITYIDTALGPVNY